MLRKNLSEKVERLFTSQSFVINKDANLPPAGAASHGGQLEPRRRAAGDGHRDPDCRQPAALRQARGVLEVPQPHQARRHQVQPEAAGLRGRQAAVEAQEGGRQAEAARRPRPIPQLAGGGGRPGGQRAGAPEEPQPLQQPPDLGQPRADLRLHEGSEGAGPVPQQAD